MRTSPRSEPQAPLPRSQTRAVAADLRAALSPRDLRHSGFASHPPSRSSGEAGSEAATGVVPAMITRFFSVPKLWPAHEQHVRRVGWIELFYDLVFAAAISQLGTPFEADYSFQGLARYAFLLALVFLAWLGYTRFATQFAIDDLLERAFIVAQVFLVAVMAANATGPLNSRDAAGFGAAYGGVRAILALQYLRVARLPATRSVVIRRIVGLAAAAIIWTASALLPTPQRYTAWAFALLIDIVNSWPPARSTHLLPPGAAHFPERFGLLTIILLGEFVASVMRGIESQIGWSFLAASAAVLSLALGFAIWSGYSDGAAGWEVRHVRSTRGCDPTPRLDRASLSALLGNRRSGSRRASRHRVAAGRLFRRDRAIAHLPRNGRHRTCDHGNRGNIRAPCPFAPAMGVAIASWNCARCSGSRAAEYADHRHRASVATVPLLRRANRGADCEPPTVSRTR